MQITITQPSDAGHYYCVVRNSYTNQTRKAPTPIILMVIVCGKISMKNFSELASKTIFGTSID